MTETPEARAKHFSLTRAFSAFDNRDFRLMWIGAFVSTTGNWMQIVAQAWVVYSLTDSAFYLGADAFLSTVPMILFSLLGGVIADRFERRRILIASQILQMTFALVLAGLIYSDSVQVWHIFILSFLTGSVQAFGGPAYQALLPMLVKREQMTNAIAMNSMQFNLARMIGPVIAGLALKELGAAGCFLLNAASFIPVMLSLMAIRASFTAERKERRSVLHEMKEGLSFVKNDRGIAQLTIVAFVSTFFGIPILTLLPVVAKEVFGFGAAGYGWLLTASGAGSVTGAILMASMQQSTRQGMRSILNQILFAVALFSFALSQWLPLSVVMLFISGAALLGVITTVSSLVQLNTAERMRGRVMSIFMMAFRGGMPLGNLLTGWVAEQSSASRALMINAIVLGCFGLTMLLTRNRVKEM
jgi:MFS family permease